MRFPRLVLPALLAAIAGCAAATGTYEVIEPEDLGVSHLAPEVVEAIVAGTESPPEYSSQPATSGPHSPVATPCGIFRQEVPEIFNLHALEHGAVIFYYQPDLLSEEERSQLEGLGRELSTHVIVMPYTELANSISMVAWGRLAELDRFDLEAARGFWSEFAQRGPESGIACDITVDESG